MLCPCHTPPPPPPRVWEQQPPSCFCACFVFLLSAAVCASVGSGHPPGASENMYAEGHRVESPSHSAWGGGVFPPRLLQQPEKQCGHLPCNAQEEAALEEAALEGARKDAAGSGSRNPSRLVVWGRNLNICRKPACGGLSGAHAALRRPSFHRDPAFWDATSLSVSAPAARPAIL